MMDTVGPVLAASTSTVSFTTALQNPWLSWIWKNTSRSPGGKLLAQKAMAVVKAFGEGDFDAPLEQLPGKKAFINDTVERVRGLLKQASVAAGENLRIRQALDVVPSAVMVADLQGVIRYANKSVTELLGRIESDLRTVVPNFDHTKIMGQNFDVFHRNPAHQRGIVDKLTKPHRAQVKFAGSVVRLIATPMFDQTGQRIGAVDRKSVV